MNWKAIFYRFILKTTGHKRYKYFTILQDILFNGKAIDFQHQKLLDLLIHCEKYVPYYKNIFQKINYFPSKDGLVIEKFIKIPPIDKQTVREQRVRLLSNSFSKKELIKETTGGSTGEPLNIYVCKDSIEWNRAGEWCRNLLGGWQFGDKIVVFWGNPHDLKLYYKFQKK